MPPMEMRTGDVWQCHNAPYAEKFTRRANRLLVLHLHTPLTRTHNPPQYSRNRLMAAKPKSAVELAEARAQLGVDQIPKLGTVDEAIDEDDTEDVGAGDRAVGRKYVFCFTWHCRTYWRRIALRSRRARLTTTMRRRTKLTRR